MILRYAQAKAVKALKEGYITVIYGARQTGKTTLALELAKTSRKSIYLNCDSAEDRSKIMTTSIGALRLVIGESDFIILDEAQRVEDIGLVAKIIHDTFPEKKLVLTGSSSLELANKIKEPLTGRAKEIILYPLALSEVSDGYQEAYGNIERLAIYGGYPKQWMMTSVDSQEYLEDLVDSYLFKDAFATGTTFDMNILMRLLKLLAYQVGSELSYNELANKLDISRVTAMRYVDLLERAFIVYRVWQFRRNQRNEVGKLRKVYFYDMGIRNALVRNFDDLKIRPDAGAVWENFCMNERRKWHQKNGTRVNSYYWRSKIGKEIDLIEERGEVLKAFEFKLSPRRVRLPKAFTDDYGEVDLQVIANDGSYMEFMT
jgi:uncharacterized protein